MTNIKETDEKLHKATFGGGCFWCMQAPFENLKGFKGLLAGYTGGDEKDPDYQQVVSGSTGHREAVRVFFDPSEVSYTRLLDIFWRQIDPTDGGGQFADRGEQYRAAIFYHSPEQKKLALESKKRLEESGRFTDPVVTQILPAKKFYTAEDYHQSYHQKNPVRYSLYRKGSGRAAYLKRKWPAEKKEKDIKTETGEKKKLKETLTPLQYRVTRAGGTEPPFKNRYWDNKREGIYVDIVSGEPLFSSADKFDSGTGWPSFTKALEEENVVYKEDRSLFMKRTEVKSAGAGSHLGHVFNDGPPPAGRRYCINSAALRFIPVQDLKKEGYGQYENLFKKTGD